MKRGADKQLTKDDSDEDHVRVFPLFMGPTLTFVLFTKGEDGPGTGFKKAEETVLATRKYVIRRIMPGDQADEMIEFERCLAAQQRPRLLVRVRLRCVTMS